MNFDDIRPYTDKEMPEVLRSLFSDSDFVRLISCYFPMVKLDVLAAGIERFKSVTEFQRSAIFPVLEDFVSKVTESVTSSGLDMQGDHAAVFMSNHRDIVMDPALLALNMMRYNGSTCEIAIGDNLLATRWITDFVRLNKSFIVRRGLSPREMPKAFLQLSSYIRYAITEKHSRVWIAQREGRAKDSDDRTQESLIKMFAISGTGSFIGNLKDLNICPLSISYEYDPCDYLKAVEFQHRRDNPDYKKAPGEDLLSMQIGIMGYKGHVHYAFTPSINAELDKIETTVIGKKEQAVAVCELCDLRIHASYVIYPINRWAYEQLTGDKNFAGDDSDEERMNAEAYLRRQLAKIDMPEKDEPFLWHKMLEMYANPLINKISALGKSIN